MCGIPVLSGKTHLDGPRAGGLAPAGPQGSRIAYRRRRRRRYTHIYIYTYYIPRPSILYSKYPLFGTLYAYLAAQGGSCHGIYTHFFGRFRSPVAGVYGAVWRVMVANVGAQDPAKGAPLQFRIAILHVFHRCG